MKISLSWLRQYISPLDQSPDQIAELLTFCGLEVSSVERIETVKGELEGLIIGEVKTKIKHPNAYSLSLTTVDTGSGTLLNIVCGAPNVDAGQKVVIATVGTTLYPKSGASFKIKKSKIRGEISEGMICAEDEIGLGTDHNGIIVLPSYAEVGAPAKNYFELQDDTIFEIELTPNRADAASHTGVARDLAALINVMRFNGVLDAPEAKLCMPSVEGFKTDNPEYSGLKIDVVIEDTAACPRYTGITISGVEVKPSPDWLQNRIKSIGHRPINNVVDITNFVLHELGHPLHAFDAEHISGKKVLVKKLPEDSLFVTLDEVERRLSSEDLMICSADEGLCIAGVFGGTRSGVTESTRNVFLESAYFNPTFIRKTAKRHGLHTEASFRFERGADPDVTVYALKRASMLIEQVTGGMISSTIVDVYPQPIRQKTITLAYEYCDRLIGKKLDRTLINTIIEQLGMSITGQSVESITVSVPARKVDVQRPVDIIEEILRIYGYNNIEIPASVRSSLSYPEKPDREKLRNVLSDLLCNNGFSEIMNNSLTAERYYTGEFAKISNQYSVFSQYTEHRTPITGTPVKLLNPLSADLGVLRQTLLFGGLESVAYNSNRQHADLKFFEFGKIYSQNESGKYLEQNRLSLFLTGKKINGSWSSSKLTIGYYDLKGCVDALLAKYGIMVSSAKDCSDSNEFSYGMCYSSGNNDIVTFGSVSKSLLKNFDIKHDVFYADIDWDAMVALVSSAKPVKFVELQRFPFVTRDLALLVDTQIKYSEIERISRKAGQRILKTVTLFDVYEGKQIPEGKKSYAIRFVLYDEQKTLTDEQVDKTMKNIADMLRRGLNAEIR